MSNKTVTLISKDGKNKIVCFKYMEEYFQKEGYVSSKKIQIRLLYFFHKIFNFTIFRKIKTFFALCLKCKFFFKNPEKKEFVFFDSNNLTALEKILPNENYSIVSTRIGEIKEIYITKEIIFFMLKNIFKCSLKQSYLTALIKKIKPKIVVTNCHDSEDFHITSKILHNSIDAYARKSVEHALEVIKDDKKIDIEFKACMRQLISYIVKIDDDKGVKNFLDISTCAKSIERIGDHAKNIAQHTIYLIKGKDIRHISVEQVLSELNED